MQESDTEEYIHLPSEDDLQNIREFEESLGQSTSLSFNDIANKLLTLSVITTEEYQKVETEKEAKKFELIFSILMDKGPHLHPLARKISEYKDKVSRMEKQQVVQTTQTTAHSDERRILSSADVSEDWGLKVFLMKIALDLDSTDYKMIVHLVKDETGFGERTLEKCKEPIDLFSHLRKMGKINRFNLLYLQVLIWHINRKDLITKVIEFAKENDKKPLYFFMPSEKPANGYRYVKVYIRGNISNLNNEEKEKQRHQLAELLCIPLQFVFLNGIQPSNSILLTFMVPAISIEIFKSLKPTTEGISVEFVEDILTIREIPLEKQEPKDEKSEWEKQVKNLMEKENKLKQELELSSTQLLETDRLGQIREKHTEFIEMEKTELLEEAMMYKRMFNKALQLVDRLNITTEVVKNGQNHREVQRLQFLSSLKHYTNLLSMAEVKESDMSLIKQLLDVKSTISAMQERQKFVMELENIRNIASTMESRTLSLLIENYLLKSSLFLTGPNCSVHFNFNFIDISSLSQFINQDLQQKFWNMAIELTKEEWSALYKGIILSETEKQQLQVQQFRLVEFAVLSKLKAGRKEQLEKLLRDILGKIKREDLIDKYILRQGAPQSSQASRKKKEPVPRRSVPKGRSRAKKWYH